MTPNRPHTLQQRLGELLLTTDPTQRLRLAWRQPQVYAPRVELGHFLMLAAMLPAVALLAGRLTRLRPGAS